MVLRNATRLTDVGTLSNPAAQAVRDVVAHVALGFEGVRERMVTQMSEIDIAYGKSPLSVGHHAGDRFAPEHYDGPPPGVGGDARFVLYAEDRVRGAALAAKYPNLLQPEARTPADGHITIVRPDGYVGFTGGAADFDGAETYLGRLAA